MKEQSDKSDNEQEPAPSDWSTCDTSYTYDLGRAADGGRGAGVAPTGREGARSDGLTSAGLSTRSARSRSSCGTCRRAWGTSAYIPLFSGPAVSSRLRLFEVIPCHVMFFA